MEPGRMRLHPRVMAIWLMPTAAVLLFVLIIGLVLFQIIPGATFFGISSSNSFLFLPASALVLGAISYSWIALVYRNFTYELGDTEIVIRQGVITRKTTVIPYATIQDIASERSMLERMLGLATLEIETAGSAHLASETDLPGIANKDALIHDIMQRVARAKQAAAEKSVAGSGNGLAEILREILSEIRAISSGFRALDRDAKKQPQSQNGGNKNRGAFEEYENFKKK